jgi:hypothetical protein
MPSPISHSEQTQGSLELPGDSHAIADAAEHALSGARQLRAHWRRANALGNYGRRFELVRAFNGPETSFGFFDDAIVDGRPLPVMGNFDEMLFDQPKSSAPRVFERQLREFVLRYLMRVSDFRQPNSYAAKGRAAPAHLGSPFSWCPDETPVRKGFGYSQWYYKSLETGVIGKFAEDRRSEIIDLREIGRTYEWIMIRVKIFDFTLTLRPFGDTGPELVIPLDEESFLVVSHDFVEDDSRPAREPDGRRTVGRYGFGYAYVKSPTNLIAYGPGQFDAAFQDIHFRVFENGEVRSRLVFVANRPTHIAQVPVAPVDWLLQLTNVATLGVGAPWLASLSQSVGRFTNRLGRFDPVLAYTDLANALTAGRAADQFCISREQLETAFLVRHFIQHYQMLSGALITWRMCRDWTNHAALPDWVRKGTTR